MIFMATSQKEYQLLMKLSAQLGKEFAPTFNTAQQTLAKTQNEIKELNRQQADITAYTKQQQAIETTTHKLEALIQKQSNIQREIDETKHFSSDLQNKFDSMSASIDRTREALQRQTDKLREQGEALRNSGIDTENLTDESEKLTQQLDQLAKKNAEVAKETQKVESTSVSAYETIGDAIAGAGLLTFVDKLKESYGECVEISASLQSEMSNVQALSGANANELLELNSLAKKLGASTKFTAVESAQAMSYMAMAGWDATQMASGMDGVLQLAAASGESLATTADIVTDNLTAFGLKASDTAHFSDVLAATATKSNTNVSIMGETFKNSAALAGALGYSIEDVATAIGLMANAGIKGSNAGTALKNVFNGLLSGVTLTSEAFGEIEYSAVNADGTMKSFGETMDDLRGYFEQMTGAEKLNNAEIIAGERAMSGFVSIMNATQSDYDSLRASITDCTGAAAKMAEIKLDNLNGQLTLLNSAADAVKTTIGEAYQNELQWLAKIGTDILTDIQQFMEDHPVLLKALIAFTAEIGVLLGLYGAYKTVKATMTAVNAIHTAVTAAETAAKKKNTIATVEQTTAEVTETAVKTTETAVTVAATAAQEGLNAAMSVNPIMLVVSGMAALAVGVAAVTQHLKNADDETEQLTYSSKKQANELKQLNEEYKQTCELYGETSYQAQELSWKINELNAEYESNSQTIKQYRESMDAATAAHDEMTQRHKYEIDELNAESEKVISLINRLDSLTGQTNITSSSQQEILAIIKALNNEVPDLSLKYNDLTGSLSSSTEEILAMAKAQSSVREYSQLSDQLVEKNIGLAELNRSKKEAEEKRKAAYDEWERLKSEKSKLLMHVSDASRMHQYNMELNKYRRDIAAAKKAWEEHNGDVIGLEANIAELETDINKTSDTLSVLASEINSANDEANNFGTDGLQKLNDALLAVQNKQVDIEIAAKFYGVDADMLKTSIDDFNDYKDTLNNALDSISSGWLTTREAANLYGITVDEINIATKVQDTIDKVTELSAVYMDAKESAEKSIQGQYDVWDAAAKVVEKSVGDINSALEGQAAYWQNYNTDFSGLLSRAEEIDGLKEILASFADGSSDSVNAVAGLAKASDSELQAFVDNYNEVKNQQEAIVGAIAGASVDLEAELTDCQTILEGAIGKMNMDDEAAQAAKSTIDAYIQAIRDGTSEAVQAAETLSTQVLLGLHNSDFETAVKRHRPEYIHGIDTYEKYASGTNYAKEGLALVGENGPEMVSFGGGEKVFNAEETRTIMSASSDEIRMITILPQIMTQLSEVSATMASAYSFDGAVGARYYEPQPVQINMNPAFNIESGASGEDIRSQLNEYSTKMVDMVMEAIEEARINEERSRYS